MTAILVVINRPRPSADGCGRRGSLWTHRLVQMVAPGILHDLGMDPNSPLEAVKDSTLSSSAPRAIWAQDQTIPPGDGSAPQRMAFATLFHDLCTSARRKESSALPDGDPHRR